MLYFAAAAATSYKHASVVFFFSLSLCLHGNHFETFGSGLERIFLPFQQQILFLFHLLRFGLFDCCCGPKSFPIYMNDLLVRHTYVFNVGVVSVVLSLHYVCFSLSFFAKRLRFNRNRKIQPTSLHVGQEECVKFFFRCFLCPTLRAVPPQSYYFARYSVRNNESFESLDKIHLCILIPRRAILT